MKRGKKGQIYLIAAIILVAIITSLAATANYIIVKPKPVRFYDLSNWLNEEGYRVIDFTIVNERDVIYHLRNFTDEYFAPYMEGREGTNKTGMLFVFGNYNNISIINYERTSIGTVGLAIGDRSFSYIIKDNKRNETNFDPLGARELNITIKNVTYYFNLSKGQNFIFVIKKCEEDECYVSAT